MLQRTHILASELVVGDPCVFVVVFAKANRANMANVHVDSGEGDFADHTPAVDRLGDGMEQTVAQALVLDHVGLVYLRFLKADRMLSMSGIKNISAIVNISLRLQCISDQ